MNFKKFFNDWVDGILIVILCIAIGIITSYVIGGINEPAEDSVVNIISIYKTK